MLIYPLTACKLDWKKPLGFLCRINSFQNQNTYLQVNNQQQPLWSSNMRKGTYLDWTQTRYYATFKVRKFVSIFYKINTFLPKTTTPVALEAEEIISVNIFFKFWAWLLQFLFSVISKSSSFLWWKDFGAIFVALFFYLYKLKKCVLDF